MRRMILSGLALASVFALIAVACGGSGAPTAPASGSAPASPAVTPTSAPDDPVIMAAGDIACSSLPAGRKHRCGYDRVARLIDPAKVDAFLALGDLQYLRGGYGNFMRYYDRFFGAVKDITYPVPGNH